MLRPRHTVTAQAAVAVAAISLIVGFLAPPVLLPSSLSAVPDWFAGRSMDAESPPPPTVVVVGSGLAGTAAALAAAQAAPSLQVILLEKEPRTGGNSAKASSGINAVAEEHGDSPEAFRGDTLASGGGRSDPALVDALVADSRGAVAWLASMGVDLNGTVQLGGHSRARTRFPRAGPSVGFAILKALGAAVAGTPNIRVVTGAKVTALLRRGGRVTGVTHTRDEGGAATIPAAAVVLACGGFGASRELLRRHAPAVATLATTNGAFAQGEGLGLASAAGGALRDLDAVQVHPTGFVDPADPDAQTKFLAPEKLRGVGGVLVDGTGRRFVDELSTRAVVSTAILALPSRAAFLVLGEAQAGAFGPAMGFYLAKGLVTKAADVATAAAGMGVEPATLAAELKAYDAAAVAGGADAFGKTVFPSTVDPEGPLYVARVTPTIHYTMGGVAVDVEGRVLGESGEAVGGLFAAGEVAGGVHGANRLGGNSLLECAVFGRRSGRAAAAEALGRHETAAKHTA